MPTHAKILTLRKTPIPKTQKKYNFKSSLVYFRKSQHKNNNMEIFFFLSSKIILREGPGVLGGTF